MPGKLRIIGGKWRSRLLPVVDLPGLRPTTARVRETLFNWLQNDIPGARCLDLFAGSGALGFEAASRGASSVTLLESQAKATKTLQANINLLEAQKNIELISCDALKWLTVPASVAFDVVFVDPPFDSDYLQSACRLLETGGYLSEQGCIYLEMNNKQSLPELPADWHIFREKKAGQVSYYLIRRNYMAKTAL